MSAEQRYLFDAFGDLVLRDVVSQAQIERTARQRCVETGALGIPVTATTTIGRTGRSMRHRRASLPGSMSPPSSRTRSCAATMGRPVPSGRRTCTAQRNKITNGSGSTSPTVLPSCTTTDDHARHPATSRTNHTAPTWAEGVRRLVEEDYPEAPRITLVMDNLSRHTGASLYKTFEPERARALLDKLEFVYGPRRNTAVG